MAVRKDGIGEQFLSDFIKYNHDMSSEELLEVYEKWSATYDKVSSVFTMSRHNNTKTNECRYYQRLFVAGLGTCVMKHTVNFAKSKV